MKAILLAAGRGTRISRMIDEIPKSTLPINDIPLIGRNVLMLINKGIKPIICVGYRKECIYKALEGLDVEYYYNPFYDITNSIASLWFAKKELTEDTIILNADVYFTEQILEQIIYSKSECVLMVDETRTEIGDFFFKIEKNYIVNYGKELDIKERSCEYVGIGKIRSTFINEFINKLDNLIENKEHQLWWENVIYSFSEVKKVEILDVNGEFWAEIDYLDDYERILNYSNKKFECVI